MKSIANESTVRLAPSWGYLAIVDPELSILVIVLVGRPMINTIAELSILVITDVVGILFQLRLALRTT